MSASKKTASREAELRAEAAEAVERVLAAPTLLEALGVTAAECGKGAGLEPARRRLARLCHPDWWAGAEPEQLLKAHDAMSRVNEAFRVLSDAATFRHHLLTEVMRGRKKCPKCADGAVKRQKGFAAVELSTCTNCNGVGYA